jgi:nucleotide-binding universal stress UspA family protein
MNVANQDVMTTIHPPTTDRAVILTAVDGSSVSVLAATAAARFAALPGSEIHLVHVIEAFDATAPNASLEKGRAMLERVAHESGLTGRCTFHLAAGAPWREVVQLAANLQADLIVVGTHDLLPVERVFLGSVADKILKKARCPVYVARSKNHGRATPEIEPPCPDCVSVQEETHRAKLWCARHSERHVRGHLHFQMPQGFGAGSNFFQS